MVTRQNGMTTAEPKAQTPEVQNEDAVKASSNLKYLKGIEAQTPVPQNEGAMKASSGLEDMDCSMKREWSDMPMNAGSKELWQWWCDNLEADAANAAACALYEPDVAPLGAETPASDETVLAHAAAETALAHATAETLGSSATVLMPVATHKCLTTTRDASVTVALVAVAAVKPIVPGNSGRPTGTEARPAGSRSTRSYRTMS